MRLAYADPPYPGNAHLYRDHPDYAGEVDHRVLIARLVRYDGWALSTSAEALHSVLPLCPPEVRLLAWVKNTVNVSWEPVIVSSCRNPSSGIRDWIHVEAEAFQWRPKPDSYVIGQKPAPFCRWLFNWLGARPGLDTLDDLFPGSGNVTETWHRWDKQPFLPQAPSDRAQRRALERSLVDHPRLPVE